eukprot:TRINITY_DN9843_c0_g2_i1.p2 TRINITY_DN9843_c0_g2~~TRINITY_DN9843_c0_g2_i1.p2  ORF type:complete len:154 (-),score=8.59 TRINITY_DN9843_c0_g2_i1:130-591(-)
MYYMQQHLNTQNFKWLSTTIVQILHPKFLILSLPNQGKHSCLQNNALETKLKKVTLRTHELIKKNINSPSISIYPQNHLALKKSTTQNKIQQTQNPTFIMFNLKHIPISQRRFFSLLLYVKKIKKKTQKLAIGLKKQHLKKRQQFSLKKSSNY